MICARFRFAAAPRQRNGTAMSSWSLKIVSVLQTIQVSAGLRRNAQPLDRGDRRSLTVINSC